MSSFFLVNQTTGQIQNVGPEKPTRTVFLTGFPVETTIYRNGRMAFKARSHFIHHPLHVTEKQFLASVDFAGFAHMEVIMKEDGNLYLQLVEVASPEMTEATPETIEPTTYSDDSE